MPILVWIICVTMTNCILFIGASLSILISSMEIVKILEMILGNRQCVYSMSS